MVFKIAVTVLITLNLVLAQGFPATAITLNNPVSANAKSVFLTGDFDNWSGRTIAMTLANKWTATVNIDRTVDHQYKFVVDGKWTLDADAPKIGDGRGNTNNFLKAEPYLSTTVISSTTTVSSTSTSSSTVIPTPTNVVRTYRAEALGPLEKITDFGKFNNDLQIAKAAGVEAFATDIWWGFVETYDQVFDWSYYDQVSAAVINAGLKWIPIMSTHQCGGYNQPCDIPVPAFTGLSSKPEYQYFDIYGTAIAEAFSPWSGDYPIKQYSEFYSAFATQYARYNSSIVRIDLSGGASGELRYPSYTKNWKYPARGQIQAYGTAAVSSFRNWVLKKYGNLAAINSAWGSSLNNINQITPPCDTLTQPTTFGPCANAPISDTFFKTGYKSNYGVDFGNWYQGSLIDYSAQLSSIAHEAFGNIFPKAHIAMKISGVHWQYSNQVEPRSAEKCAGYWDYSVLLKAMKSQDLETTFTAIERDDVPGAPEYSGAHSLPIEFFGLCDKIGAKCGGENALEIFDAGGNPYSNMREILTNFKVLSLTFLRFNYLVNNLDNIQGFSTYVSTIVPEKQAIFFKVANVNVGQNQRVAIVGNVPTFGSGNTQNGFLLQKYCENNQCFWIGTAKVPITEGNQINISLFITNGGSRQCGSFQVNLNTKSTMISVNQGVSDSQHNGIRYISVGGVNLGC